MIITVADARKRLRLLDMRRGIASFLVGSGNLLFHVIFGSSSLLFRYKIGCVGAWKMLDTLIRKENGQPCFQLGMIFEFNFMSSSSSEIIGTGVAWARSFTNGRLKTNLACSSPHGIGWQQAAAGWIICLSPFSSIYRGVIHDSTGEWLLGFSTKVAGPDVFQVEA